MIQSVALLKDLKAQLKLLQADLKGRADDTSDRWGARLHEEYAEARRRERTGHSWVVWRDNEVDQAAVAWLVATTFIRFCEDNDLLAGAHLDGRPGAVGWIAGPGDRTQRAEENLTAYFRVNPTHNRRDWLRQAFATLAAQPAGAALVDRKHNPVWTADISAERAAALMDFWRKTTATGDLVHDFRDPDLGTRFLGDLYQDLSEHAKKTYALLQTPQFVEEFILDQTLSPALVEFGHEGLKIIDPTCGSGHFLLGAFQRMLATWAHGAPALDAKERVRRAMDSIHGVDLNPFAVAIARFRLTVAALLAMGERSLVGVPGPGFHLAIGDSLIGEFGVQTELNLDGDPGNGNYLYATEDLGDYLGILRTGQYHVVVGNPPYIGVKDKSLNSLYRKSYKTAAGKYALSAPFAELFFRLAIRGEQGRGAGYVGQITSNSFMKREFGKKLVEDFFAGHHLDNPVDLIRIIDVSGAWMPGHNFDGTPTVILVGRRRRPVSATVRCVLGIKDDAGKLADPSTGPVWTEIANGFDTPGFIGEYLSVADVDRTLLKVHPWSLSGGEAADLKSRLGADGFRNLASEVKLLGVMGMTNADDVFLAPERAFRRRGVEPAVLRRSVTGPVVRDYLIRDGNDVFFPYDDGQLLDIHDFSGAYRWIWPARAETWNRATFAKNTYRQEDRSWWEWHQIGLERVPGPVITFAEVATHNYFVFDRGGKLFNQSAPIIKLPEGASEECHLALVGVLNSSVVLFWLKQVAQKKGGDADTPWLRTYQFNVTKVGEIPLPEVLPVERGRALDGLAQRLAACSPKAVVDTWLKQCGSGDADRRGLAVTIKDHERTWGEVREQMVFEQEELDWEVYGLYGLLERDIAQAVVSSDTAYAGGSSAAARSAPKRLTLGARAFEIALARKVQAGEAETQWFSRHAATSITDLPVVWPHEYRDLVERRLRLIESDPMVGLLETPDFKRRWETIPFADQLRAALTDAVLDRLEQPELWRDGQGPVARSVREIADLLRVDDALRELVEVLTGDTEADLANVLSSLVAEEAVPYLAAHRYKPSGLEKFRIWQDLWALQRREDAGDSVDISVPPTYNDKDFSKKHYWQVRGKLDVPKERFIFYPGIRRESDATLVLGWAGWDHRDQALALVASCRRRRLWARVRTR